MDIARRRQAGHQAPVNQRLWRMVERQARAKFAKFPSPAASVWMHKKYQQLGGRFRDTRNEKDRKVAEKLDKQDNKKDITSYEAKSKNDRAAEKREALKKALHKK